MYNTTLDDLRVVWDDLKVRDIHQANNVFNASECYLDNLTEEQLQFLVDKHGTQSVLDRLKPINREEE